MKQLVCSECQSTLFSYITGIDPESISSEVDEILQCGHCGRYKFLTRTEVV